MFNRFYKDIVNPVFFQIDKLFRIFATGLIAIYKVLFSGYMGWSCRFYPSCSCYSLSCYKKFNFFKASYLTLGRLWRCRPFSGQEGFDPVPPLKVNFSAEKEKHPIFKEEFYEHL